MAEIHPVVQALLNALLVSDLSALGRLAEGRILEDVLGGVSIDSPISEEGARGDEVAIGLRQLKLANEAVEDVLGLELGLLERNQRLLKEYRSLSGGAREADAPSPRLETVIVGDALGESGTDAAFRGEDIATGARRERLRKLLNAWHLGVGEARVRLALNGLV